MLGSLSRCSCWAELVYSPTAQFLYLHFFSDFIVEGTINMRSTLLTNFNILPLTVSTVLHNKSLKA